jgi:hypothetical protein
MKFDNISNGHEIFVDHTVTGTRAVQYMHQHHLGVKPYNFVGTEFLMTTKGGIKASNRHYYLCSILKGVAHEYNFTVQWIQNSYCSIGLHITHCPIFCWQRTDKGSTLRF